MSPPLLIVATAAFLLAAVTSAHTADTHRMLDEADGSAEALRSQMNGGHVKQASQHFKDTKSTKTSDELRIESKKIEEPSSQASKFSEVVGGSDGDIPQPVTMALAPTVYSGITSAPVVVGTTVLQGGWSSSAPSVLSGADVDVAGQPRWARQYPNISVWSFVGHGRSQQVHVIPAATPTTSTTPKTQTKTSATQNKIKTGATSPKFTEPSTSSRASPDKNQMKEPTMAIAYGNIRYSYRDSGTFFLAAYRLSDGHPMWALNFTATRMTCVPAADDTHDAVCLVTQPNATAAPPAGGGGSGSGNLPPWGAATTLIYVGAETGKITPFAASTEVSFDRFVKSENRRGVFFMYLRNTHHVLVADFVTMTSAAAPKPPVVPSQVFYIMATVDGPIIVTTYAVLCPLHGTAPGDNITTASLRFDETKCLSMRNSVRVSNMIYIVPVKQLWFWGQGSYNPFLSAAVGLWSSSSTPATLVGLPIGWSARFNVHWSRFEPSRVFVTSLAKDSIYYANVTSDDTTVPTSFAPAFALPSGMSARGMIVFPDTTGVNRIVLSTYFSYAVLMTMEGAVVWKQAMQNSIPLAIVNHQRAKDPLSQVRIVLSGGIGCATFWGRGRCNTGYVSVALPAASLTTPFPPSLKTAQYGASVGELYPVAGGKELLFSYVFSNTSFNSNVCRYTLASKKMTCTPASIGGGLKQSDGLVWNHDGETKSPTTIASLANLDKKQVSVVVKNAFTPHATTTGTPTKAQWLQTIDGLQQLRKTERYFWADGMFIYELSLQNTSMLPKRTVHFANVANVESIAPFRVNGFEKKKVVAYVMGQSAITYFFPDVASQHSILRAAKPNKGVAFSLGPLPLGPGLQNSVLVADDKGTVYRFHATTGALIWSRTFSSSPNGFQQIQWRADRVFVLGYSTLNVLDLETGDDKYNVTVSGPPLYSFSSMLIFGDHTDAVTEQSKAALFGTSKKSAWMIRTATGATIGKPGLVLPGAAFDASGRPTLHLAKDGETMMLISPHGVSSAVYAMTATGAPLWEAPMSWVSSGVIDESDRAVVFSEDGVSVLPSW